MLDISSPKVSTPAALFLALSPGVLLTVSGLRNVKFMNGRTSRNAVLFHALVFVIAYKLIAKKMGLSLTRTDLIVPAILFIALSPGMLLTLPPSSGGVFRSGQTSLAAGVTHAIVFAIVFALLRKNFPSYY